MSIMTHPIASLADVYAPRGLRGAAYPTTRDAFAPSESRESDCSSGSDAGSVGPLDFIGAYQPGKKSLSTSSVAAAESRVRPSSLDAIPAADRAAVLSEVFAFLPLADIDAARAVNADFAAAAARVAPQPFDDPDVVFVRWQPQQEVAPHVVARGGVAARRPAAAAASPSGIFSWRCLACGAITTGPRSCQGCRTPLATSACRVFIGQLRKDLSAELATAMVRSLAPDVTILHMESHTNGVDGRGKGCAWAYVNSVEDALRVCALHKRVFVDLDADDGEGFWYVKNEALVPRLGAMADVLGASRGRRQWLPRQPLVAELPAKSMLAEFVKANGLLPL